MRNMKYRAAAALLAVSVAAAGLTGCGVGSKLDKNAVVATVGEEKINLGVANFYARYQQVQVESSYAQMLGMAGEDLWAQELTEGETYEDTIKDGVLKGLEQMYILKSHMADYSVEITEEEQAKIDKAAFEFVDKNNLEAKEMTTADEKVVGEMLTLLTIQKKMTDAMTADVSTEVSDEEAAQKKMQYVSFSYSKTAEDGSSATMTEEEKAAVKASAQAFADGAGAAEDFAAYATEQGYEATDKTFDAEDTSPSTEMIAAVNALSEGQTSGVIESENGCYVAKLVSALDREATDAEKQSIINQRKNDRFTEIYEGWQKAAKVEVDEKVWEKVDFVSQGVTMKEAEEESADNKTEK